MSALSVWEWPSGDVPDHVEPMGCDRVAFNMDFDAGLGSRIVALPILNGQSEAWLRPSGAACFPLHPVGALELYRRVVALRESSDLAGLLGVEATASIDQAVWRFVRSLVVPGALIRTRIEHEITEHAERAANAEKRPPGLVRLEAAAFWLVIAAATAWAREVSA